MLRSTHNTQSHNLAARMGRWSAAHWKTATFGWLAFVLVAFGLGGMVGTRNIDNAAGPGESGRMDRILEAGFKQPAAEHVLIQSRSARVGTTAFDAAIADVVARVSKIADVQNVRSPLAPGNADQISKDGHSALVEFQIRGDKDEGGRQDRPGPRRRRRRATRPSGLHDRRVRRRERGEGRRDGVRRRPRQGGNALAPDHADRPRAHLRLARGGGHSAAARADRRLRDLRARRALERPAAGRDAGPGDGAPDRARGRRRLLDVLLEARTAGAGRGPQPAGGARDRRRHLRAAPCSSRA